MFFFKLLAARHFGPADFGIYEMIMTIFGIAVVLGDFGISQGVQRYISFYISKRKNSLLEGYMIFIIFVPLIASSLLVFLLLLLSSSISNFFSFDTNFSTFLNIIALAIPLRVLISIFSNILVAHKNVVKGSFPYNVLEKIILLLGIIFIIYLDLALFWLIIFFVLSLFSSFILSFLFFTQISYKKSKLKLFDTKDWVFFSLPLIFTGVLVYILNWSDNFIIAKFMSAYEVGIYGVAYSLSSYLLFIPGFLATLFLPVMTKLYFSNKRQFIKIFSHLTKWLLLGTIFVGGLLIYFSDQILYLIFGQDFTKGSLSLIILTVFFIISCLFAFNYYIILITKHTKFLFYNYLFFALFNIALSIFLVNLFGVEGVAFSSGLSFFLLKVSEFIKTRKSINFLEISLLFFKISVSGLLSLLFVKLVFLLILNNVEISVFIKLFIALLFYLMIFLFSSLFFKTISKEDVKLLKSLIRINVKS